MSSRNAGERNGGSRNDSALNAFTSSLEFVTVSSAFVQTCGHRNSHYSPGLDEVKLGACPLGLNDCRAATALFMANQGELDRAAANAMSRLARSFVSPRSSSTISVSIRTWLTPCRSLVLATA